MNRPTLQETSNYFFGAGIIASTLASIFPPLAPMLALPVVILWIVGYTTWYVNTLFYEKETPAKTDRWYGFAKFKEQHQIAALLGTIAAILRFVVPTLIAPAAALFFISNVFWTIGVVHKKNKPPKLADEPEYLPKKQVAYTYLAYGVTLLSFVTALSATSIALFPLTAPMMIPIATCVASALAAVNLMLLIKYLFGHHQPDTLAPSRPATTEIHQVVRRDEPEPTCFRRLFCCGIAPAPESQNTLNMTKTS